MSSFKKQHWLIKGNTTRQGMLLKNRCTVCVDAVMTLLSECSQEREGEGQQTEERGMKRQEKNRDAARRSRRKQTERADELHEVRNIHYLFSPLLPLFFSGCHSVTFCLSFKHANTHAHSQAV